MVEYRKTTDPEYTRPEKFSAFERFWLKRMRDERDLPFIYLTLWLTVTIIPMAILLYMPFVTGWVWGTIAFIYTFMSVVIYKSPYTLMLHCTSHRPMYKSKHTWLNRYIPWFLGPFMGQSPETYFGHHIAMHHLENNLEDDDSTTMHYQRDSVKDFFTYNFSFMFFGLFRLSQYFKHKNRPQLRKKIILGELSLVLVCVALSLVNFWATFIVLIFPVISARFIMMLGNWAQHAFVDADDPGNEYKNSVTCVNYMYNKRCWNDGYHISHHIKPTMHWTEHPGHLRDNLDEYAANKALVFDGIGFGQVWYWLMKKDYQKLADHLVNINGMFKSDEDAIAHMKERTARIPKRGITMTSLKTKAA